MFNKDLDVKLTASLNASARLMSLTNTMLRIESAKDEIHRIARGMERTDVACEKDSDLRDEIFRIEAELKELHEKLNRRAFLASEEAVNARNRIVYDE